MAELDMVMGTLATSRQESNTTFEKQKNESDSKVTQTLQSAQNIPLEYNYKNLQQDQIAEEASEQQTSSMVRSGLLDAVGADLINKFSKYSQSIISSLKMMTAIEKQDTTKKLAIIDGVTEGLQRISEKPREIDLGNKDEPEEKGFMQTLKEKISSTVGIAGDVLFGSKSLLTAGLGRMIASPVGAGIAAGVGIAGVAAGVGMVAGSNAPGIFRPEWFEGLNKSKHSNEELAEKISKYWQKHGGPNDKEKMSWFIGSVVGESSLKPVREYAPKGVDARAYFNKKYGKERKVGRELENTQPDDGYKFRGGGIIQLTGRGNYTRTAKEIGLSGPDELSDRITEFDISLEAAVIYFLKRPGHPKVPVKASSFEEALSRIGRLPTQRERNIRAKGREDFLKNVAKYPVTETPDYNNGMYTDAGPDNFSKSIKESYDKRSHIAYSQNQALRAKYGSDCSSFITKVMEDMKGLTPAEKRLFVGTSDQIIQQLEGKYPFIVAGTRTPPSSVGAGVIIGEDTGGNNAGRKFGIDHIAITFMDKSGRIKVAEKTGTPQQLEYSKWIKSGKQRTARFWMVDVSSLLNRATTSNSVPTQTAKPNTSSERTRNVPRNNRGRNQNNIIIVKNKNNIIING